MAAAKKVFDKRLKNIQRKHDRLAQGSIRTINSDGLIVVKPRMYKPMFPLKGLLAILFIGFLFKGFLFAYLGEDAYVERVVALREGTVMEQAGAWVMSPDPVTVVTAQGINSLLGSDAN